MDKPLTCRSKPGYLVPYAVYKEETLSWEPYISMFYDVISDQEIERVRTLAAPGVKISVQCDVGLHRIPSIISQVWNICLLQLYPRPVLNLKLIIPEGYIRGNSVYY